MRNYYILFILILLSSCSEKTNNQVLAPQIQDIIDLAKVEGSVLIYDSENGSYYSNDFLWANKGNLPASTFKIPNSIIAIECAIVENDSTLLKWDGKKRNFKIWEQDLIFADAFRYSCVPCYQEIAREIGLKRMNSYLAQLEYGAMKVDAITLDRFWLEGESRISQFQQIDFLKRFYESKLPISARTKSIVKKMMVVEENENYRLSGKTGWSIRKGNNNGWFVGYVETGGKVYYFALNIEPKSDFNMKLFPQTRKEITKKVLKQLEII